MIYLLNIDEEYKQFLRLDKSRKTNQSVFNFYSFKIVNNINEI